MAEIALNGLMLDWPRSGSATYARNLVSRLPTAAPDLTFTLYVREARWGVGNPEQPSPSSGARGEVGDAAFSRERSVAPTEGAIGAETGQSAASVRRIRTPFRLVNRGQGVGARIDKFTWETVALPLASIGRPGLIHSLYFAAPPIARQPIVVTIHDLIRLILPGYHRHHQAELYDRFMLETARRAAAIITVSQHAKDDIVRVLHVPSERVHVTYEAADEAFSSPIDEGALAAVRGRYGLPERYLLYVGSAERRKNLETLINAWSRVVDDMRWREVRLVLVTELRPPDLVFPDLQRLIGRLGLESDVLVVPWVREDDKPAVYRAALGFCFPSTYEGFGLPLLEAMASGTPVLAARAASIPEVTGVAAGLLPPLDAAAWGDAMLSLVDSETWREDLRGRGLARVRAFSWDRTARETVEVYRTALG